MLRGFRPFQTLHAKLAAVRRSEDGIAAVEFALLLPLMLLLYFGSIEITQAVRASRKVDLVASALANLASQQLTCSTGGSAPCLTDTDMTGSNGIFTTAAAIMSPYWCDTNVNASCSTLSTLGMTVSQVNVMPYNGNLIAKVEWTVTYNGGTARPCNGGGANNSLQAGNVSASTAGYQNYFPTSYTASGAPTGRMIVADIAFQYKPGFGYNVFKWNDATTAFKMTNIGYFRNRNNVTNPNTTAFPATTGPGAITDSMSTNKTSCHS